MDGGSPTKSPQGEDKGERRGRPRLYMGVVLVCVVLVGGYFLPMRFAYGAGSGILDRLLYPISHAGCWHLLMNVWCVCLLWWRIGDRLRVGRFVVVGFMVQVLGSYLTEMCLPTLGASGWGYYLAGVGVYMGLLGVDLLRGGELVKRIDRMLLVLVVGIAVQALFPFFNAGIHGVSLLVGVMSGRWVVKEKAA